VKIDPVFIDLGRTALLTHEQGYHATLRRIDKIAFGVLTQRAGRLSRCDLFGKVGNELPIADYVVLCRRC
jgi:hypothetical protein